jgi:purine-nucleoside phosphorylase
MTYDDIRAAAAAIGDRTGRPTHDTALVLGSGLSGYAASLPGAVEVPYTEIPGFPVPKVEGHAGSLFSAEIGGAAVLVYAGRVHTYEGWPMDKVVFAVRSAVAAGCRRVILTNASGGVGDGMAAGDLVLISDHLNLTGRNPLEGPNDDRLGVRFPDMSEVYSSDLRATAHRAARRVGIDLTEGVYAWMLGPSYETPSEIQMVKRIGGHLVGMSTVPEAIAARHMGAEVLGISLVTNLAAGISTTPLSHEEVKETADAARERFTALLDTLLADLGRRRGTRDESP